VPSKKVASERLCDKDQTQEDITSLVKILLERYGPQKNELAAALEMDVSSLSRSLSDGPRRRYWQAHEVLGLSKHYGVAIDAFYGDKAAREEVRDLLRNELLRELNEEQF
jgi:hypothetical protein